jgi:hypothetical protein
MHNRCPHVRMAESADRQPSSSAPDQCRAGRARQARPVAELLPRALVLAAVLFASLGVMAATAPADTHDSDTGCNILLKGLKMLSDPQRKLVNLHPKNTTVAAINALPQPHATSKTRSTGFSRRVWRVPAQITEFKLEGDSDIHLILFDAGSYLIAEMPAGQCIPKKARDRKAMIAVRRKFETQCGKPTTEWQPLGAVV